MGQAFLKLHIAILLAGFTGILGKLISLAEGPLVWYRMLFTAVLLFLYLYHTGRPFRLPLREACRIGGIGVLVAVHWIFFYGSIKYANVSIAVVCFALTGFFTAILEPLSTRTCISLRELSFSLLTVAGIVLIFHFDTRFRIGIVLGVLSAVFASLFTIGIKNGGKDHPSDVFLFYQMLGGFPFLSLVAPLYTRFFPGLRLSPDLPDLLYLLLLSSACTIGLFLLQIQVLQKISAFTVSLSFNLEPVYSIALAMLLFGEAAELTAAFYVGLGLICLSVLLQSLAAASERREAARQRDTPRTQPQCSQKMLSNNIFRNTR